MKISSDTVSPPSELPVELVAIRRSRSKPKTKAVGFGGGRAD